MSFFFKKGFIYLFLEREEGREKERERHTNVWLPLVRPSPGTWPATQACALTGNRTGEPLVRRPALNPLSYTSQGMFIDLREREKGGGEILMSKRNIDWLPLIHWPGNWTWPGMEPATFWCTEQCSYQLSHLDRASLSTFNVTFDLHLVCRTTSISHNKNILPF